MKPDETPAKILVCGDVLIDHDIYLTSIRQSPENVPVVRRDGAQVRMGGAGAVALMAAGLGADVFLSGIIGHAQDEGQVLILKMMEEWGVEINGLAEDEDRPQTLKSRTWLDGKQQYREDWESTEPIDANVREELLRRLPEPSEVDCVLIADYAKGVITVPLMREVYRRYYDKPIIVDPHVKGDWAAYELATCLTPNRDELLQRSCCIPGDIEWIVAKLDVDGIDLWNTCDCDGRIGESGRITKSFFSECRPGQIVDPCGAGDMVLAALGVFIAEGRSWPDAARLANKAAGLKCLRRGAVPVERELLMAGEPGEALSYSDPTVCC